MSDYDILHERTFQKTGHWGRAAAGVLFVAASTGRLGLVLRSPHVLEPNTYGVVGGAVDPRENKRLAVAREAQEELGMRIDPKALLPLDVFKDATFTYTTFLYVLPRECEACTLNWENTRFEWHSINELPPNLHPGLASTLTKTAVRVKIAKAVRR